MLKEYIIWAVVGLATFVQADRKIINFNDDWRHGRSSGKKRKEEVI